MTAENRNRAWDRTPMLSGEQEERQVAAMIFLNTVSIFEQTAPVLADSFIHEGMN
jgi:hypothetical protein